MTRWKADQFAGTEAHGELSPLRNELARRHTQRVQRRVWLRWKRRRLMLDLLVVERELTDAADDRVERQLNHQADRISERLARNARRLFR